MSTLFRRLIRDDSGQDIIEYALVAAGIAVLLIPTIPLLGQTLITVYTNIGARVGALAP